MLTADRLRELVEYDPETGIFTSKVKRGRRIKAGQVLGWRSGDGYLQFMIDHKIYKAHRLAWLYMTGAWPREEIDHRNLVRDDNRWTNLRHATRAQNQWNVPAQRTSTTGFKGVSRNRNRFQAQIMLGGKRTNLGFFQTPELAHAAYVAAAERYFGEFARAG